MLSGRVEGSLLRIPPTAAAIDLVDCPSALMPELAELRGLEQVVIVGRLHRTVQHVVKGESLTPEGAAQLYALSARIERPLHADSCAEYRALLRRCCEWRASVSGSRDPMLPHLSILIGISGAYFGQDEELAALWQEDEEGG